MNNVDYHEVDKLRPRRFHIAYRRIETERLLILLITGPHKMHRDRSGSGGIAPAQKDGTIDEVDATRVSGMLPAVVLGASNISKVKLNLCVPNIMVEFFSLATKTEVK